jgi:hypothetical protein
MPFEVALLTPQEHSLDVLRALGETMQPPMLVRDTLREGTITVTEFDETPIATFGRPRRVETTVDLVRAYGPEATLPGGKGFVTEAIVPFQYRRGMALVFALEDLMQGKAIVMGVET